MNRELINFLTSPKSSDRLREIPYNYTSFSDKEIVIKILGTEAWEILKQLRLERQTGRSARMLFEVLGDIWVIERNPYLQDDMLFNRKRRALLIKALYHRLNAIRERNANNSPESAKLVNRLLELSLISVEKFKSSFEQTWDLRKLTLRKLRAFTKSQNIRFDSFSRASHVTDATDWRVEYPFVVIYPDHEEEIPGLVQTLIRLNFTIIPRGGGTGYSGGAIPLHKRTAVINTEKLNNISKVEMLSLDELQGDHATIRCEAGAVNKQVADTAAREGWVFSVDPNSNYACTIGGNIAENAGGKKALLWGTTIDNIYWYRMVDPQGRWVEVTRLNHNLGKIHNQETVRFRIVWKEGTKNPGIARVLKEEILELKGAFFRLPGLGKDVTNKFLGGLPALQKEGTDGIVTSARFILHKMPKYARTVCLEFYGAARNAGPAIYEIAKHFDAHPEGVMLAGLEHLDDRYLHAISYAPKSNRDRYPKMVIVGDLIGDDENALDNQTDFVSEIASRRMGDTFVAKTAEARRQFWAERSKTSAISKHTNAFKLNEDIVIPLDAIGAYTDATERFNICCSIANKIDMIDATVEYLNSSIQLDKNVLTSTGFSQEELLDRKRIEALKLLETVRRQWDFILRNLDMPAMEADSRLELLGIVVPVEVLEPYKDKKLLDLVQNHVVRVSWKKDVESNLKRIYGGDVFESIRGEISKIHDKVLKGRVFIALHMHAGDGNVHTNIPVNSDDTRMMEVANWGVDYLMQVAKDLGGAISGEHGIGMTKISFVEPGKFDDFYQYLGRVDPLGHFNRDKLRPESNLSIAYTPSFNLLGHESLIMQQSHAKQVSDEIKTCLRCGKCKPVCSNHSPNASLLYSPRNKIIATSLLLEAFLYEEQTRRGVSKAHFTELEDISDHCTVCSKCYKPCPVKIDFGHVTMLMRSILNQSNQRRINPAKIAGLKFLELENPVAIRAARKGLIQYGFKTERLASDLLKPVASGTIKRPGFTTGRPSLKKEIIYLVNRKLPNVKASTTARKLLDIEDSTYIPIIRDKTKITADSETVFYFPGCGGERLFSEISIAVLGLLYDLGVQVILPPGYRCCGHPQEGDGLFDLSRQVVTRNRVLFHRVANTLNYKDINTVLVSCGTCHQALKNYDFEKIFPGCRLIDVHDYLLEKGVSVKQVKDVRYIYHDPCHSPLKGNNPLKTVNALLHSQDGSEIVGTDRCCGESGTFAISRPDISNQVRFVKERSLKNAISQQIQDDFKGKMRVLTTCPGCLQGLSRYEEAVGTETQFLAVEMARQIYGEGWMEEILMKLKKNGIEKVLL
ncbi:MAG: DUF3683 domain-containing protein [Burkholderiaceae bacterium]|nr:DUF3683 domain-containing protein [Burkholderiaceae bacterium]